MNIFFTTPFDGKEKYQKSINAILHVIKSQNTVVTPEDTARYMTSLNKLRKQGLNAEQAHYAFIRQGIASADVVIIEASEEDIRVGHELTLALLFHKPTLVLSQYTDFSRYITHDLLQGALYKTDKKAQEIALLFLETAQAGRPEATMQTIDMSADSLHAIALAKLRQLAKQEPGQFGEWARLAEQDPAKVAGEIHKKLGALKKQPAWSVFAPIYNEDSPDYIQAGVAKFVTDILKLHKISNDSLVAEAACGTAALSRQLVSRGLQKIKAFDVSRPMLAEAFRLSASYPQIELFEADVHSLNLPQKVRAMIWTDYSSNFALNNRQLKSMLNMLAKNLDTNGILLFDIRTYTGWQIDFYSQPVTTFATDRFQRLWLNKQDYKVGVIDFDVFIRLRDADGGWSAWQRESMTEKMWVLQDVLNVVSQLDGLSVEGIYGDDFRRIDPQNEEPNLAYFVLRKVG